MLKNLEKIRLCKLGRSCWEADDRGKGLAKSKGVTWAGSPSNPKEDKIIQLRFGLNLLGLALCKLVTG
jgi:hypothetical protein